MPNERDYRSLRLYSEQFRYLYVLHIGLLCKTHQEDVVENNTLTLCRESLRLRREWLSQYYKVICGRDKTAQAVSRVFSALITLMCQFPAHGALKMFRGQDEAIGFGAFLSRLGFGDDWEPSWVSRSWLLPVRVSCQRQLSKQPHLSLSVELTHQ